MATDYITPNELLGYMKEPTSTNPDLAQLACTAASRGVEMICDVPQDGFNAADTATARRFHTDDWYCVEVHDFYTTTGLILETDNDGNGTYDTTWTIDTDFVLEPDHPDRPYSEIVAVGSKTFLPRDYAYRRRTVRVTAKWGYTTVPDLVIQACLVGAQELYNLPNAPLGVAGYGEYGAIRVKNNPKVRELLGGFIKNPITVA